MSFGRGSGSPCCYIADCLCARSRAMPRRPWRHRLPSRHWKMRPRIQSSNLTGHFQNLSATSNRVMPEAVTAAPVTETQSNRPEPGANLWSKCALAAIAILILAGLGLRLSGLESIGFAEDEINKLEAVHAYDRHDFSANAEHPMLMKVLMDVSLLGARAWNSLAGGKVSEEAALRFPNVLLGALTVWPMFLLTAAFFDRRTGIWAAAFWAFGVNAITYNRIGKEDTLMVFFMLFAFYFFLRAKQVDTRRKSRVRKYLNLSAISFGLMMAAKYFPHYLGLNMLYHHKYHVRERDPAEPRFVTPFSFFIVIGITFLIANP